MEATNNKELKPYYYEDIGAKQIYGLPKIRSPVNVLYPNNQLFYPELKPNLISIADCQSIHSLNEVGLAS